MANKPQTEIPAFNYEVDSVESWDEARRLGSVLGEIPHLFSAAVRFLMLDADKRNGKVGPVAQYCLSRLTNSLTVNGALYFAVKACAPERIKPNKRFRVEDVLHSADIASIIALLYLHRRLRAGCNKQLFAPIEQNILRRVELGALIGAAIPSIGIGFGILIAAARHIGSSIFLGIDPEHYEKYWKTSKRIGHFDCIVENKTWGCNHLQVASIFYQRIGLGVAFSSNLFIGLGAAPNMAANLPDHHYTPFIAETWIAAFEKSRSIPSITHRGQFYPVEQARKMLLERLPEALDSTSPGRWLTLRASDVTPETTPEIFVKAGRADQEALRKAAKEEMSEEEFNELEDNDSSFL